MENSTFIGMAHVLYLSKIFTQFQSQIYEIRYIHRSLASTFVSFTPLPFSSIGYHVLEVWGFILPFKTLHINMWSKLHTHTYPYECLSQSLSSLLRWMVACYMHFSPLCSFQLKLYLAGHSIWSLQRFFIPHVQLCSISFCGCNQTLISPILLDIWVVFPSFALTNSAEVNNSLVHLSQYLVLVYIFLSCSKLSTSSYFECLVSISLE